VLDVTFAEDASRIRKDNAPQNFSLLRHFVNLSAREDGEGKLSDVPGGFRQQLSGQSRGQLKEGNSRRVNTRFEVGRESLPLGFTWVKEEKRGLNGGRRLLESSGQQQAENMEVIGDVEWQLGNFTLEICQIILDAFTLLSRCLANSFRS